MFLDFLKRWEQDLQLSCWTKFDLKLAWWCKIEEKTFPFLAVWNYRSPTIFGNFSSDLKSFNDDVWNVKWDLYGYEWDLSNHFPPSNPWLNAQLTTVDFARVLVDWAMLWWISNLYYLRSWFQMISQLIWTLDEWSWCLNSQEWPPSIAQWMPLTSLT